jgi:hypothetical protein
VFVEPDGDRWRVDVISRPGNRVVASDHYPDEGLAVARAQDFARMLEQLWWQFDVRVHRRFKGRSDL